MGICFTPSQECSQPPIRYGNALPSPKWGLVHSINEREKSQETAVCLKIGRPRFCEVVNFLCVSLKTGETVI